MVGREDWVSDDDRPCRGTLCEYVAWVPSVASARYAVFPYPSSFCSTTVCKCATAVHNERTDVQPMVKVKVQRLDAFIATSLYLFILVHLRVVRRKRTADGVGIEVATSWVLSRPARQVGDAVSVRPNQSPCPESFSSTSCLPLLLGIHINQ
jgi:hypothetical protein